MDVIAPHDYHHVLAIAVPEYPPKPDDDITFSFAARRMVSDESTGSSEIIEEASYRDSKKAREIFPESLLAHTGQKGSLGGPAECSDVKPGGESAIIVPCTVSSLHRFFSRRQANTSELLGMGRRWSAQPATGKLVVVAGGC